MSEWVKELWQMYRRECLLGLAISIVALVVWVKHPVNHQQASPPVVTANSSRHRSTALGTKTSAAMYVDIKGAVRQPGVYRLGKGSRVQEALRAAGGPTAEADIGHVNLAKQVQDAQVVYIPKHGEQVPTEFGGQSGSGEQTGGGTQSAPIVNINSASKDQLQQLTGVGEKKADLIIAYRQAHGGFKNIDELGKVQGFGEKTVAKLKDQLAL